MAKVALGSASFGSRVEANAVEGKAAIAANHEAPPLSPNHEVGGTRNARQAATPRAPARETCLTVVLEPVSDVADGEHHSAHGGANAFMRDDAARIRHPEGLGTSGCSEGGN
jgi:hypothetical protein